MQNQRGKKACWYLKKTFVLHTGILKKKRAFVGVVAIVFVYNTAVHLLLKSTWHWYVQTKDQISQKVLRTSTTYPSKKCQVSGTETHPQVDCWERTTAWSLWLCDMCSFLLQLLPERSQDICQTRWCQGPSFKQSVREWEDAPVSSSLSHQAIRWMM